MTRLDDGGVVRRRVELTSLLPARGFEGAGVGAGPLETAFDRLAAPRLDTALELERGRITLVVLDEGGTLRTIG